MAEYRGLTIRIGADTSRFTAALKATQSAIASTQKNLRQLKQALTFDPGSKNASALYVGELQSQAVAASAKLQELRKHIQEVQNATPKTNGLSTFKKLAEDTDNAALSAQRAKAAFNDVTDALAQIYTNISAESHEEFDMDDTEVKRLTQSLKDAGIAAKEVDKVLGSSMESIRHELASKGKASVAEIESIMKRVELFKNQGVTINVTNSSMDTITSELQRLVGAGRISQEEMDETIAKVSRLKSEWTSASNAYDDAKVIDQLHNDSVEVAKLEAQVKSLAEQMVDATRNAFADDLEDDINKLRNLGTEVERAEGRFERADQAFKLDPGNIDLSISRMQALDEATDAAKREAESLTDIIGQYEAAGIDKVAASTENLTQATADAKQNLVDANAAVIMQEREIDEFLDDIRKRSVDGNPLNILDAAPKYRELMSQLDELKQKQTEARESYQLLVNAGDYTEKVAELETVNNKITEFGNTARDNEAVINAFAESLRNAFSDRLETVLRGDKSALEGLGEETKRVMDSLSRTERAMELDPSNIDKVVARSQALETAMSATNTEMEQTQKILDRYSSEGIDKVAAGSTNLKQELSDAEAYAQAAAIALASYKTNVENIDDGVVEFFTENLSNAVNRVNELRSAMDFRDKEAHLEELRNGYDELGNKVKTTTAHLQALANAQVDAVKNGMATGFDSVISDLDALSAKTDAAKQHFEAMDASLKADPTSLERARDRATALAEATQAAKDEAAELDAQIARLSGKGFDQVLASTKNIAKETDNAEKRWRAAEAAVKRWKAQLANARAEVKRLEQSSDGASDELEEAKENAARLEDNLNGAADAAEKARSRFAELTGASELAAVKSRRDAVTGEIADLEGKARTAGEGISTALFMALQEVGQEAKKAFDEVITATTSLDDALTEVKKTVDTTDEGYERLKESAVELSKVQPIDASTILQAEALGGQLGFAADEVEKFAEVATGLDVATNMSWNDASTDMARFFNIMGLGHEEVENYGSAIVDLGNNYATTEQEISDMALRIAGAGASMNLGAADVLGLATALTSVGLTAEAGGSSISQIMVKIDKAVANGTEGIKKYADDMGMSVNDFIAYVKTLGDTELGEIAENYNMTAKKFSEATVGSMESLETWADTANMTADEFVVAWKEKPIEALTALFSGMDKAAEEGSNLNLLLDDLGIKTIRQSDVARRVANSSDKLVQAVNDANDAYQENTALSTEVERRNESLSAQMDIMANSFDAVKAELGEGLLPLVKLGVGVFQDLSNVMNDVPVGMKTAIISLLGALAGLATTVPILNQLDTAFGRLSEKVVEAGGWGAAMSSMITPTTLGIAALGAIGVAAYAYYKKLDDARKRQEDFNNALSDTDKIAESFATSMDAGKNSVSSFGIEAERRSKTLEELTDDLNEFNESIKGTMDPVDKSNALLGEYRTVLDKFAGKGHAYGADLAELEWAVRGINDALGTDYTAQDILTDKYENEKGEIESLCDKLDTLIAKRQEEARMEAAQGMYTKSLEKQYELDMNVEFAKEDIQNFDALVEERAAAFEKLDNGVHTHEEIMAAAAQSVSREMGTTREQLEQDLDAAQKALEHVDREVQYSKDLMTEATSAVENSSDALGEFVDTAFSGWDGVDWGKALEENGIKLDEFAQKAHDAGVTARDLKNIYDDPDIFFADMVKESAGDIDALIAKIKEYNETEVEQKEVSVNVSDDKLALDESKLAPESREVKTTYTADVESAEAGVSEYNDMLSKTPTKIDTAVNADTEDASQKAITLQQILDALPSWKNIFVNVSVDTSALTNAERRLENLNSKKAAGGIRYHADGVILNRPTWIGNRDIAGEAGAEAIIPLTNRRYVQPFADTVADGMMSKIGEMSGTTNNYVINGLTVAPDSALAKAMDATFDEAKRLSRMGRR